MKIVGKKKYYVLEEAARFLGEPIENVRSWIGKGGLPTRVIDGQTMIPAIPLNDFYHDRLPAIKRQRSEIGQTKRVSEKPARKEQRAKQAESTTRFSGEPESQARTPEDYAYYYTPGQVAEMLAMDLLEVNQLVRRGDLSTISVGKHRWLLAKGVEDLVRQKYGPGRLVNAPKPRWVQQLEKRETKKIEPEAGKAARKRTDNESEPKIEPSFGSETHYTADEVSKKLGRAHHEVWKMAFLGELRVETVGDQRMFLKQSVDDLLRSKKPSVGVNRLTDAPEQRSKSSMPPASGQYKICTKCSVEKPIEAFNRHPTSKDGLQSNCRECNKVRSKERYQQNRGNARDRQRQRVSGQQRERLNNEIMNASVAEDREEDSRTAESYYYTPAQAQLMLGKTFYKFNREKLPIVTIDDRLWILAEVVDDLYRRKYGERKLHNAPKPSKIRTPDKEGVEEEARAPASPTAPREPEYRPSADPAAAPTTAAHSAGEIESADQASPTREASSVLRKTNAERAEEGRRRVMEAAQRLGKSINEVRQMVVAGQLVPDPEGDRLVTPYRGAGDPADDRAIQNKSTPSRPVLSTTQELEEKVKVFRDELRTEKEEKEHLSEELKRERAEHSRNVSDAQRELDQLEAELENTRRDHTILSETLQEDRKEERSRRLESERWAEELQDQLDEEIARKLPAGESREDAPSNENLYGRLRAGVRGMVGSLKDSEHPSSELEELKAELEAERKKRSGREEWISGLQSRLDESEAEKKALEVALSSEKEKANRLEADRRVLEKVRRLLGAEVAQPSGLAEMDAAPESLPAEESDGASGELLIETRSGQWVFRPPFALEDEEVELIRLVAGEDEITADQIKHRTGRRRAADDLDDLLDRLADEGLEPITKNKDRYSFDPDFMQD